MSLVFSALILACWFTVPLFSTFYIGQLNPMVGHLDAHLSGLRFLAVDVVTD